MATRQPSLWDARPACPCTETVRCAEAHALRDAYLAAPDLPARVTITEAHSAHLRAVGLLSATATASPTWVCAVACEPDAPCRA